MLGFVDIDSADNLPMGLAHVCRNSDFSLTSVMTRAGLNLAIQGLNSSPITGLIGLTYTPESTSESFFQLPLLFDLAGALQGEYNIGVGGPQQGVGATTQITSPIVNLPVNSHMIGVQAYNNAWLAFSNLISPTANMAVYNLRTKDLDPYGMKPFGWVWQPRTQILLGEVATPSIVGGNGHTYQCIQAGTTGAIEPTWPTAEFATVADGSVVWEEYTMVLASALPAPAAPVISLATGGSLTLGDDIYVMLTMVNGVGETVASSASNVITTTPGSQTVTFTPSTIQQLRRWIQSLAPPYEPVSINVYVAVVAHGFGIPPTTEFALYGNIPLASWGNLYSITMNPSSAISPPITNTARVTPGYLPPPVIAPAAVRENYFAATFSYTGKPPAGQTLPIGTVLNQQVTFPGNYAGSYGSCGTNPNSHVGFGLGDDGGFRNIGEVGIDSAGNFTFTSPGGNPITVLAGHQLTTFTPKPQNSTLSDVSFTLVGNVNGNFPDGRDVYFAVTYSNSTGETTLGPASSVINTAQGDGILVTIPNPGPEWIFTTVNLYEADVPTGTPPPTPAQYALQGRYTPGALVFVPQTVVGPAPPVTNQSGPAGNIALDSPTGGLNASQGYRYASVVFINRNYSDSGFTKSSVVKGIVDYDGFQLGIFNVATGPSNILAREVVLTEADGTNAGPFFGIGSFSSTPSTNFVYPATILEDGAFQSATILGDNVTTSMVVNFTDSYLIASNDLTDRLQVIWPYPAVDIYYSESNDRMIQTGVPGFNGHWVSLAADPESYYNTSFVPTSSAGGERAICAREFRGTLYSLRERSGFTMQFAGIQADGSAEWKLTKRWDKVGPCGPRAVDVCGRFMIFVHRSGIYKYSQEEPEPVKVSKEIRYWWQGINWQAAQTICCSIDEEDHCVRIQVPYGNSQVPNQQIKLYYEEGWNLPIHFSTFSGHEISMDSARRYSIDDVSAFVGMRIERNVPLPEILPFTQGDIGIWYLNSAWYTSQFLYGSSSSDGSVMAITPGVWHDSGADGIAHGIDWQYETMAPGNLLMFSKIEGSNINARGKGQMFQSFLAGRAEATDWNSPPGQGEIRCIPFELAPNQPVGITRFVESSMDERWRARFTNGKIADSWAELKYCTVSTIPISSGRPESQG